MDKSRELKLTVRESFEISPVLFYISACLFILGPAVGLIFDWNLDRLGTLINTAAGLVLNLVIFILTTRKLLNRSHALGYLLYVTGLVFLVETFLFDYTGDSQLVIFLTNLVIVGIFSAVAGILVTKTASVLMGTALLAYLIFYGRLVVLDHPDLGDSWVYMIIVVTGLILMTTYYRIQLEQLFVNLHRSGEDLRVQRDEMSVLKSQAESALEELKLVQKKIIVQEKLASLGALTAGIAHEIKNPLNFVNNFSESSIELMEELRDHFEAVKSTLPEDRAQDIEYLVGELVQNMKDINEHGRRGDRIVKNMLMHSRGGKGSYTSEDLNVLVEECAHLAYHGLRAQDSEFKAEYAFELDPDAGAADIVRADVSRVLLNLMNNGFYAADEHHRKRENRDASSGTARLVLKSKGKPDSVEIRIRDNGPGIPQDVLTEIFTPFFTTKPTGKGTGLGLSISREIIADEHRGSIDIDTVPGEYTEFIINIPRSLQGGTQT